MDQAALIARYRQTLASLDAMARRHGRPEGSVRLLAVSKGHGPEAIAALCEAGQRDFGENYAQELLAKAEALRHLPIRWHFIGHLQTNKARRIMEAAASVETVASWRHAEALARHAEALGRAPYPVFLEVNADAEPEKAGCSLAEAAPLAQRMARELPALDLQGLFAIPKPLGEARPSPAEAPPLYRTLRALADDVGRGLLSLGMSDDLEEAVAAGSDWVRVGTAIFGPRPAPAATKTTNGAP